MIPKALNICCYINIYNKVNFMHELIHRFKTIAHYPQLDTVLMVENFIRENSGEFRKRSLWEHLPRKMMYQTFCVAFDYLLESGKIATDSEGKIVGIWNPDMVNKYISKPHLRAK